ncbi:hypothetical protein EX895_002102 [Sporisorium graminicola]|uniref:Defects in morphology protein 1 n=1 Tax=Sporisorium graminicola TaxID=280036 RepID=A0A4U7KW13_9BASI|nr:hypothetical protein EX895_002102 [Sporisorium graminicola]TKY88861.1 hypothetical protein EX895_002102 [Sporisorium graminicola]
MTNTTASSSTSPHLRSSRRRVKPPPTSLPDHFARKGYLSVSDLVAPSWCEYNYQYGILSLSHLPPSQRPATITTEAGQTLAAAPQLVAQKESTLQAGKAVHTVLERQVAPVQVVVETETNEDAWALRLLNLWCDVQGLIQMRPGKGKGKGKERERDNACVREVPVYGWIHGVLVMGVIDEIEKRTVDTDTTEKEKGKTWASQEEWKKHQLRKTTTSPKKPKTSGDTSRPLTAFFGSSQPRSTPPTEPTPPESDPGWAYFLSDTKTRISSWLPAPEDQYSARMQCMTYKRLLDGLLLGSLSAKTPPSSSPTPFPTSFDTNATPMDWTHTFNALDLDPHQPLSASFLRDAQPLCESWGTDLALFVAQHDADVCTLHHVRLLLEAGLRALVEDAGRGGRSGIKAGVVQDALGLTYRRQVERRRGKRKKPPPSRISTAAKPNEVRQATLDNSGIAASGFETEHCALDDEQLPNPPQPTERNDEGQKQSLDALQGRNDTAQAIQQTLGPPPPTTPRRNPTSASTVEAAAIIGTVTFLHDPSALDTHLRETIRMWKGQRALVGVAPDQTRRCWTCEWMQGCEWRAEQARRHEARATPALPKVELDNELEHQARAVSTQHTQKVEEQEQEQEQEGDDFWSSLDYDAIQVRDAAGNVVAW